MQIMLNGEPYTLTTTATSPITISTLLGQLGLAEKRIAVERNEMIVPRSRHAETALEAGDQVEIVHAIGGG
ncbi:thiamine biosynthesis protein ThiS [Terasakiispira papahanaumokuakeensis]|uniref:Thiamine biosynthesis protein ThiS n=1 Tax=Terasakiispira papahanaumokuakeensis TaxID=197479 RepID=A0A1E2VCF5_9GAMM|nr:sulfur carrier protein ThiS [Terasakiispira papahanaumokuakeensis]ODC04708.1 thiamine biosynthesis protein ThiS [Terasakiispira papahanaumokuakeensis]